MVVGSLVIGNQRPAWEHCPKHVASRGDQCIAFAARAGLILDDWQQYVLRRALATRDDGLLAAFEVALIVPRQNGKGGVLEAYLLWCLFVLREPLTIYSAHEFKTAQETFLRIRLLIEQSPHLLVEVKGGKRELEIGPTAQGARGFKVSTNETGITLETGERLRFMARSGGAGRGFTARKLVLDEAYDLPDAMLDAVIPTLATARDPQVWYASSAGKADSDQLRSIRDRGRSDDAGELCYLEWCGDPNDPEGIRNANPAYGIRISDEFIRRERAALSEAGYLRERYGVWDEPGARVSRIPADGWLACTDPNSKIKGALAFGVDVSWDRSAAAVSVVGQRKDGDEHGELIDARLGTAWVVERCVELNRKHSPAGFAVQPGSPAASLIPALQAAGLNVMTPNGRQVGEACGGLYDAVIGKTFRHLGQPELATAFATARARSLGDVWLWDRATSGGAGHLVMSLTLARWAYVDTALDSSYAVADSIY